VLWVATALMVVASIAGQVIIRLPVRDGVYMLAQRFNLDLERSIPTAYSVLLLLTATLLLTVITVLERKRRLAAYWAILSMGFLTMAVDEGLSLHEELIEPGRELLGGEDLGVLYFPWVVPGMVVVLALGLFFLRFLARLPPETRRKFLLAAVLYVGGAIGFELIGGAIAEDRVQQNWTYAAVTTVEEFLEMGGVVVFIQALLVYLSDYYREVRFRLEGGRAVN
jgi:hypothetical protein